MSTCRDCGTDISPDAKRCRPCYRESTEGPGNANWKGGPNEVDPTVMMGGRCGGYVGPDTTRDDLLRRGFTPESADEVIRIRDLWKRKREEENERRDAH